MLFSAVVSLTRTSSRQYVLLTIAMVRRFDATELRSRAKQYTQWPDMPHLDESFIAKNVQHLTSLGLIQASATS